MTATTETTTGVGRVARVTGPVVDVEFPVEAMPELYNALTVDVSFDQGDEGGGTHTLTLEVAQHIGDNMVRAISMQPTDGLVRGAAVTDSGSAITVPVGDVTKGHVWNTLGVPLDVDAASLDIKERWSIHRQAPAFDQLESKTEVFDHRYQGHRPAHPLRQGRQDRPIRRRRRGQDGADPGDDLSRR
jgi:F-type H+/Na+-transporting ATPase subunit beta